MKAYYEQDGITIYHGDCREILPQIAGASAVIADPPYNIGKAAWDSIPDYEEWCDEWIRSASASLSDNGAFWCYHSDPVVLADLCRMIESHGRKLVSFITLDKSRWTMAKRYANAGTKSFPACVEYVAYLRRECYSAEIRDLRAKHNLTRAQFDTMIAPSRKPTGICYRWEHGERVPQPDEVTEIERRFGVRLTTPSFNNPEKFTSVWDFPPPEDFGYETVKPLAIARRVIASTTNPGDLIAVPFGGSGTDAVAARELGRRCIAVEKHEAYCEIAAKRLAQGVLFGAGGAA